MIVVVQIKQRAVHVEQHGIDQRPIKDIFVQTWHFDMGVESRVLVHDRENAPVSVSRPGGAIIGRIPFFGGAW